MAIGDAYASVEEYRARMRSADNGEDTIIEHDLLAVSRYMDRVTGYTRTGFNKDASDVTRVIKVPQGNRSPNRLRIPPLSAAPTSVTIDDDFDGDFSDETALTLTQYTGDVLYEPEDWEDGPEQRPIHALVLTSWNTKHSRWAPGALVQIVGKFGWPSVPKPIEAACIELTGIWRLESARATNQVTTLDQVVGMTPTAQRILDGVTRVYRNAEVLL